MPAAQLQLSLTRFPPERSSYPVGRLRNVQDHFHSNTSQQTMSIDSVRQEMFSWQVEIPTR